MRRRSLALIATKELLDTLRDRRTLFIALVLPLLLYPALLFLVTGIIGATRENLQQDRQRILFDCLDGGEDLATLLENQNLEPVQAAATGAELRVRLRRDLAELAEEDSDGARARIRAVLREHEFAGALLCGDDFGTRIAGSRQAEATLLFDSTDEGSKVAEAKVRAALQEFAAAERAALRERFPTLAERLQFAEAPVRLAQEEVASRSQRGAYSFAPLLGLLIVVMALTGAFYPAVDLAAGEKERGTMETLLVAPVTRLEIVVGKFLAIWIIAVVTALLNLFVMGLTFSKLAAMMPSAGIAFSLPFTAVAAVTIILVPTSALFAAVSLALSAFATSYKEGQHYMTPLFLVAMPLSMVALLPNVEIGYGLALVPVANVVLLVKAMLLGGSNVGPSLVATVATAGYAGAGLWAAVTVFRRESILFRTGSGESHDAASLDAARRGVPTAGRGFLLFFSVVALMFFFSTRTPETTADAVRALVLAQAAVLLPTLVFAKRGRHNLKRTLSLRPLAPAFVPLVVLAAASTLFVVLGLLYPLLPEREPQGLERVFALLEDVPPWLYFCLLAVLPPLCEELLCRGFLLASFRSRYGVKQAVLISALLFGALHLDLYRFPGTFAAGLMLGYVLVATRSILAPILFHVTYNGILALATLLPAVQNALDPLPSWVVAAAVVVLVLAVAALRRLGFDNPPGGRTLPDSSRP